MSFINYVIIDPIGNKFKGITVYTELLEARIKKIINPVILKKKDEDRVTFQKKINQYIEANFSPQNTIIEAPETGASTIFLDKKWIVHIRLHCLQALSNVYDGKIYDRNVLEEDLICIKKASFISGPSKFIINQTKNIINIEDSICYPNPVPVYKDIYHQKDVDVLFLGRFQKLKGIQFLPEICQNIKGKIVIAGDGAKKFVHKNKLDATPIENVHGYIKDELISKAKQVIIPSLFESFSMVAVEALANNALVVAWNNNAIIEIANAPLVRCAKFGDTLEFRSIIQDNLTLYKSISPGEYYKAVCQLDGNFIGGFKKILTMDRLLHKRNVYLVDGKYFIPKIEVGMESSWTRKIKKLKRNPYKFFMDSKLLNIFANKKIKNQMINKNEKKVNINSTISSNNAINMNKYSFVNPIMIGIEKPIKLIPNEINMASENNLLLFISDKKDNQDILNYIDRIDDVVLFRDRHFFICKYEESGVASLLSCTDIVNSIDRVNKEFLNSFSHIVFVNPSSNFLYAVRFCTEKSKIIVALTDEFNSKEILSPDYIDILICPKNIVLKDIYDYRRYFLYQSKTEFFNVLRHSLRESLPKPHNMFIPVLNRYFFEKDIDKYRIFDVLLSLELQEHNIEKYNDLMKFIRVKSLMMREEKFLAYKNLIEFSIENNNFSRLLTLMTYDGVRCYVQQ